MTGAYLAWLTWGPVILSSGFAGSLVGAIKRVWRQCAR